MTRGKGRDPRQDRSSDGYGAAWHARFLDDLHWWVQHDPRGADRLLRVVKDTMRHPFEGIGKPEPLRGEPDAWSRRLTEEHRVLYQVRDHVVTFLSARGHYR